MMVETPTEPPIHQRPPAFVNVHHVVHHANDVEDDGLAATPVKDVGQQQLQQQQQQQNLTPSTVAATTSASSKSSKDSAVSSSSGVVVATANGGPPNPQQQQQNHNRHRRANSDFDMLQRQHQRQMMMMQQMQMQQQMQQQQSFPPTQIVYNNNNNGSNNDMLQQQPPLPMNMPPPMPPPPHMMNMMMMPPPPSSAMPPPSIAYSPSGNPLIPMLPDPNSTGGGGAPGGVGVMPQNPYLFQPPPPPPPSSSQNNSNNEKEKSTIASSSSNGSNKRKDVPSSSPSIPPPTSTASAAVGGAPPQPMNPQLPRPGHRRVHSYSGSGRGGTYYGSIGGSAGSEFFHPMYGGTGGGSSPMPPLPPYRSTSGEKSGGTTSNSSSSGISRTRSGSGEFSPRNEFRKLVATSSPRRTPPTTPRGGGARTPPPLSPTTDLRGIAYASAMAGAGGGMSPIPPMFPAAGVHHGRSDSYSSFQSGISVGSSGGILATSTVPTTNLGVYTGLNDDASAIIPPSPRLAGSIRKLEPSNSSSMRGGEAVFLLNNGSGGGDGTSSNGRKKGHNRHSSQRKMHMRQRSAQLFMETVKGEEQLPACRNIVFLLLFVFHLLGIVFLGRTYGYESLPIHNDSDSDGDSYSITLKIMNLVYLAGLSGAFAVAFSGITLFLMMSVATKLVQIALILAITLSFAWGTMGVGLSPTWVVPATGLIALFFSVAYAFIVWDRIPFAAANLDAGLSGIKANPGTVVVAFVFQLLALGWSIYFTFVVFGVYDAIQVGDIGKSWSGMKYVMYTLLGISYYWTLQVFLNIVQVTVAGVIGSWWYKPDDDTSTRVADLKRCFFRSCFYSIGSICFGGLVVGPVRVLRQLSAFFRPSPETSSLLCLHQCVHFVQTYLTSCVETLADRFSPWSFTYVGLYGYGLVDAGLHASELFETRGWTKIVSDDLIPNVLFLTSLVIGGVTGLFAYFIEGFEYLSLTSLGLPATVSFVVGGLVGLVVSSVLFGIISSSVNAVIVCFAASPVDFQHNHPKLSEEMRGAWREVWPGAMDAVDLRVQVAGYTDVPTETHPLLP